ncbi:hypothetical protein BD408DRAFT_405901 [Parasitella parasitica]|nr:hypothetical protein BD408DRAFT_405901 [Parasitella parasitica]
MPTVSIGKPKRSLNNDSSTRSRTYKDMLKETHKDDWKLDLSNLTFVPPTAKGKHIRSVYNDSKPLITETSKVAFEIETEDMDSEYVVQVDDKLQDAESDKNCSDEGNQNNLDEVEKLEEGSNTEFESLDKITKTAADYTLPLQHKDFIPKENHCEHSTNQNTTNDHCLEVKQEKINYLTVVDFENDAMQDGNMINNDTDDGLYEYSEEESHPINKRKHH